MANIENLHPQFLLRAEQLKLMTGCQYVSAWRSSWEQEYLFNHQGEPGIGPANPPGTSNHEAFPYGTPLGLAIDFALPGGLTWPEFHVIARAVGIHFPILHEAWHGQPIEVVESYFTGVPELSEIIADDSDDEAMFIAAM